MSSTSILLIQDNPAVLPILDTIVGDLNETLVKASSDDEVMRHVNAQAFGAIVLDADVQGKIGFEIADRIRAQERARQTPIIFLIENGDLDRFQMLATENIDFVLKPVVPRLLRSKIAVYLDLYRKTEELKQLRQNSPEQGKTAHTREDAAQRRMDFLLNASALLSSSLDYETTLANLTRLAVPTIADWCAVDMLDEDGVIRRLAVAHKDPAKIEWAYEMQRRYPPDPNAAQGMYTIVRTGQPTFIPELTDEMLVAAIKDKEQLQIARELGVASSMSVPLTARGRTLGVFSLTNTESGHHFDESDMDFAQELANRAALAVDNARLYREATKQREYLQVTLASIGDAVIATDAQGCVTFMNPVAESLTDWSQAEAMGKQLTEVFEIVNETSRLAVETPVTKVIQEGNIVGLANHTILLQRGGREIPIDDSGAPIRDADGEIVGVILVFRDITERKKDENALVESEERFRTMADTAPILIWMTGVDMLSYYFNKPWLDFTGRELEQELGNGWADGVHPDDLPNCLDVYRSSFNARQPFQMEFRLRHSSGQYRWVVNQGVPRFTPDDQFIGYIGACTDIDQRKQTESALEQAIEYHRRLEEQLTLLVGVSTKLLSSLELDAILQMVLDASNQIIKGDAFAVWRFISADEGWRIIASHGLSDEYQADIIKSTIDMPPFEAPVAIEDIDIAGMAFARREPYRAEGIRSLLVTPLQIHNHKAGTLVFYNHRPRHFDEIEIRIAMAYANMVAAAIGSADLYSEAHQALSLRNEFLSVAAHELKTPVTSLRGYAQAVARQIDKNGTSNPENIRKALATIDQQSVRLTRLIERLLDISRIEAGRFTLDFETVNLMHIVEDVVSLKSTTLTKHTITVNAADQLILRGDPLRIEQVLTNLLDNAIKFSPDGGIIAIDVSKQDDSTATIVVTDRGIGIPLEKREHLFKQFYQAHEQGFLGGLGLGLYISHEIIKLHNGSLSAEYPADGGTRFVITLPIT